tara:strand:- start:66 stop:335 length:270 start_codon:yes stop_codon:yes gene_type:complete
MIAIHFISKENKKRHVASFIDEDLYISCLDSIEAQASKTNSKIEETLYIEKTPTPSWEGVEKILHKGYWYGKYADLKYKNNQSPEGDYK